MLVIATLLCCSACSYNIYKEAKAPTVTPTLRAHAVYMHIDSDEKQSAQGGAAWGDLFFQFYNAMPRVTVVDLAKKQVVQEVMLNGKDTYHCNNVNFGREKFQRTDRFPLLYVSMENKAEHCCLVYRITGEVGSLALSLVQTITYPVPSDISLYYPNAIIDSKQGALWLTGYKKESWHASPDNMSELLRFRLPRLSEGNVQLQASDVLERYEYPSMTATQGAVAKGGKLYQVFDVGPTAYLRVFNRGKIETEVKLHDAGLGMEPENLFVWNGRFCYTSVQRDIRRLDF